MRKIIVTSIVLGALYGWDAPYPAYAQAPPPEPAPSGATVEPGPVAPPFKPGMPVVDRMGASIGTVQSVTETPGGPNVVLTVDGKLVGVAPRTLRLQDQTVVSSQTKAQILAAAGASR